MLISYSRMSILGVRALVVGLTKGIMYLIGTKWKMCLWNFIDLCNSVHCTLSATIFCYCTCSTCLAFFVAVHRFVCHVWRAACVPWGEACDRRSRCHVVVFCILLHVTEDCSPTKGRIPILALRLGSNRYGRLRPPPPTLLDWLDLKGCTSYVEIHLIRLPIARLSRIRNTGVCLVYIRYATRHGMCLSYIKIEEIR